MVDRNSGERKELDKQIAIVDSWINRMATEAVVGREVTPVILKTVLAEYGANFDPQLDLESLAGYTNKTKRKGLENVWGEARVKGFLNWAKSICVPTYERKYGHELPTLYDPVTKTFDNVKYSGMMAFFGELTAYAAGKKIFEDYAELTERRMIKGMEWIPRKPGEPYKTSKHSAFLPEFAKDAWNYIKDTAPQK